MGQSKYPTMRVVVKVGSEHFLDGFDHSFHSAIGIWVVQKWMDVPWVVEKCMDDSGPGIRVIDS
jgi:hypothetical protein